ncbi:MAG: hypothetical protein IPL61_25210 [Myxococcales bacterium]|nr:hypothetical protein [Myxococcales bacterium]
MFEGDRDFDLDQQAVMVSVGQVRPSQLSLRASIGAVLDGTIAGAGRTHDLGPGVVGAIAAARPWTWGPWFVHGTLSVGASRVTTTEVMAGAPTEGLVAVDARIGVSAGRRFGPVMPYVLARGFGGPVLWTVDGAGVTGTDAYHVQLGAGASVTIGDAWSVMVDVSALGERAASVGVAWRR